MAFYDRYAKENLTPVGLKIIKWTNIKIIRLLSELVTEERSVLEIGAGRGHFARLICAKGWSYVGLEPNKQLYSRLKDRGFSVLNVSTAKLPFEPEKFSVVYLSHVLEHLSDYKTILSCLEEYRRVLRPDGYLAIFFPDFLHWKQEFWNIDYSHSFPLTERRIKHLLIDAGFIIKQQTRFAGHLTGLARHLIYPLVLLYSHSFSFVKTCWGWFVSPELLYKAKITFIENVLIVAKKR